MKEIEVIVKKFEANDGTRFDDKESCDKYEEECKKSIEAYANRIAMIKAKKIKIDEENAEYARKQELELKDLSDKILSMGSRIKAIISVGEELHKDEFKIDEWNYGACRVGFAYRHYQDRHVEISIGMSIASCLGYDVIDTDGEAIRYNCKLKTERKIYMLKMFLKDFNRFETNFYKWVDEKFN